MAREPSAYDVVAWLPAAHDPEQLAGAAFLVSRELALTCAHVVREHLGLGEPTPTLCPTDTLKLRFDGLKRNIEAKVAPAGWWPDGGEHEIDDVAVLEPLEPLDEILCPSLAIRQPTPDLDCEVYGGAGAYPPIGRTVKTELGRDRNNRKWRQLDARDGRQSGYLVEQGFSGSPVLDPLGNTVWGMVATVELDPATRVAFAIPASSLREAVETVTAATERAVPVAQPRAPGPADQLAREALATLLGEEVEEGEEIDPQRVEMLRSALRDLAERARTAADEPAVERALAALKRGEKDKAEALFKGIVDRGQTEAAAAARHLGALAYLDDTRKAIEAYATATRLDPDHTHSWILLGRLHVRAGDLAAAGKAYRAARAAAERAGNERDVMVTYNDLGAVQQARGELSDALSGYEAGLAIAERLVEGDPDNTLWQRDLSVSHNKIGDVRRARGDLDGALDAYEADLAIAGRLVVLDPEQTEWQRDLSVSHDRIGDVRVARGDLAGALAAYEASLAIRERLAVLDPEQTEWQRDLSVSHNKIGDVRRARGDLDGALDAYEASLAIAERLAARDPEQTQWQRDLSVSHDRIGDVRRARGDLDGALAAYEAGLAIRERLAARDPEQTEWQRDLALSFERLGDMAYARDDAETASVHFRRALEIRSGLAERDPTHAYLRRELIIPHVRLAELATRKEDGQFHYRAALDLAVGLHEQGRLAPVDVWMIGHLEARLAALDAQAAAGE